jgi:hypothetical protein
MSSALAGGVLSRIRKNTDKLDAPRIPLSVSVIAQPGTYVLVDKTPMQQMMIFIEGLTGSTDALDFTFKIELGGNWFDWHDGSGEAVRLSIAGDAKGVFGPFQCPMKVSRVRLYEVSGSSTEEVTFLKDVAVQNNDVQGCLCFR